MEIKLNKIKNKWWGSSSSSSSVTFWNVLFLAWLLIGVLDIGFGARRVDGAAVAAQTNNVPGSSSSPTTETSGTVTGISPPPVSVPVQIQSGSSSDQANTRDHAGSSRSFTPSISELSVPFRDNPKIILGNFPGNSVVLPLLNGEVSASNYLVHLARQAGNSDPGYFIVEAPKNYGVMAVIQQLHLRRISDSKSLLQLVNNCKDYVLFEGHNGEKTIPICGTLEKGDNSFYPANLHGPKFFNSPNGRIKVTFRNHYSYGNDLDSQNGSDEQQNQEMIMVEIAFTAYSNCTTADEAKGKFQCTLEKCIDSQLACDKTVNCAPGENQSRFGVDETNCTRSSPTPPPTGAGAGTGASRTARPEARNANHHHNADHNLNHENREQIAQNRNNNGKYHQHHHHHLQQQLQGRRFEIQVGQEDDEEDSNLSTFLDDDELLPVSIFNQPKNPTTKTIKSPTTAGSNSHNSNSNHHHNNNENETNNSSSESSDDDSNSNNTSPNNSDPNEDNSRLPNLTTIIILVIILALVTICGYFWSWVSQFLCAARSLLRSAEVGVVQQHQQQQQQHQSHIDNNNVSSSHNSSQGTGGTGTGAGAGGPDHQQQQHHPRLPIAYYVPAVVLRTTSSSNRNHHHHHHNNNHINSIQAVNSLNSSTAGDKKMSEADSPPPSYELLFPGPISGSGSDSGSGGDSTKIGSPVTVTVTKQIHDMKE